MLPPTAIREPMDVRRSLATARAMRAAVVAGLSLALLGAAWTLPVIAILVVWPLLYVAPGWAIVALARPRIEAPGRLGLSIVISVLLSSHLVWWLSLASGGYGRGVVFAAALLLALLLAVHAWREGPLDLAGPLRALRRSWSAFALAGLAALFVGGVLGISLWRVTLQGVTSGGSNWSDLGVHLGIAQSLNAGNFPPQVPYFAGLPLVYHWFADLHAAMAASAAGLFSVPAMVVQSAILAGALALLVHALARHLVRGPRARRAALIAAALAIFGGGLGYLRFIGDLSTLGDPLKLVAANSYDNQWLTGWPYFRIPSVMGTGLLVHRATTAGLPILVGGLLLLVAGLPTAEQRRQGWRDRPVLIGLAGALGALLAPFHFFFFPAFLGLALLYVLIGRRLDSPRNALLFLAPYVLALPFALPALLQSADSGSLQLVRGWESAPIKDGPAAVAFFYLTNLGLPFVLALDALLLEGVPRRAFLAAWVALLFWVPNIVQVSVIAFDMNKYFQAMWIAVAILAGWLVRRWPAPALVALFAVSTPAPLLVAVWTATSDLQVLSAQQLAAADWVAAKTPPRSVFVTDGWVNSLTDPAGRLRLTTFGPYIANLGYGPDERIAQVHSIYCAGLPVLSADLMRSLHASYVIDAARPSDCTTPTDFGASDEFALAYQNPELRIWHLTDAGSTP
ncbi:MAG: hypothetical protein M3R49_07225 [Chloroflexota bacterium]|nr:hypothetical protein [Chloroflexota bacterium]